VAEETPTAPPSPIDLLRTHAKAFTTAGRMRQWKRRADRALTTSTRGRARKARTKAAGDWTPCRAWGPPARKPKTKGGAGLRGSFQRDQPGVQGEDGFLSQGTASRSPASTTVSAIPRPPPASARPFGLPRRPTRGRGGGRCRRGVRISCLGRLSTCGAGFDDSVGREFRLSGCLPAYVSFCRRGLTYADTFERRRSSADYQLR